MIDINFNKIHEIFSLYRGELDTLAQGINTPGEFRDTLDDFLNTLGIEKNSQTRYAASQRMGNWKFEPLQNYLEKIQTSQQQQDIIFEQSYTLTRDFVQKKQEAMLTLLRQEKLVPEFYMTMLEQHHELGKLFSNLFLVWNRALIFGVNRRLEAKFMGDGDAIRAFLESNNLFDMGHYGERADRCYSILQETQDGYKSSAYADIFKHEVNEIIAQINILVQKLENLEDEIYNKKSEYIAYYKSLQLAIGETNIEVLVEKWAYVDTMWMAIDTPFQPAHPIEYYEDKYRKAVSIELDFRIGNPDLLESEVKSDIEHMYEGFYDEIGREGDYEESYGFSRHSMQQVQLHLGVPYFSYGSFLCGMYSAQVVPNDAEVSKIHGKKIFAFPGFILQSYRSAPKMQLDYTVIHSDLLKKHEEFLHGEDKAFYKMYDIETIGHEFGHTLWLTPNAEVKMNRKTGLFKCIEEFKATAGGMVAYFFGKNQENKEDILITCLYRNIKMMRYREVEDVLPYYCECLISLSIFYNSGIISIEDGKINLHITDDSYESFKKYYIGVYTHQIHTYLNKKDAGEFLYEYVEKVDGIFLPIEGELRDWVENYYALYQKIGNEVMKK